MKTTAVHDDVSGPHHHVDAGKMYVSPHAAAVIRSLRHGGARKRPVPEECDGIEIGNGKQNVETEILVASPFRNPHRWSNETTSIFGVLVAKVTSLLRRQSCLINNYPYGGFYGRTGKKES